MKPIRFSHPHVYVAIFKCEQCNGPTLSRLISEGPYPDKDMPEHTFPTECAICKWIGQRLGSAAEKILQVEWNHEIHFQPRSESTV